MSVLNNLLLLLPTVIILFKEPVAAARSHSQFTPTLI